MELDGVILIPVHPSDWRSGPGHPTCFLTPESQLGYRSVGFVGKLLLSADDTERIEIFCVTVPPLWPANNVTVQVFRIDALSPVSLDD